MKIEDYAEMEIGKLAYREEAWKRKEREEYINETCRKDPLACKIIKTEWRNKK